MAEPKHNKGKSKQDFQTPPEFLDALKSHLDIDEFTIDLAASADNKIAPLYYDIANSALVPDHPWQVPDRKGWAFCNPPFANIAPWVEKASFEAQEGAQIAMLLPASVGANWWADWVHNIAHVLLLNGRIQFVGATDAYPRDCAILLYSRLIPAGYSVWAWKEEK